MHFGAPRWNPFSLCCFGSVQNPSRLGPHLSRTDSFRSAHSTFARTDSTGDLNDPSSCDPKATDELIPNDPETLSVLDQQEAFRIERLEVRQQSTEIVAHFPKDHPEKIIQILKDFDGAKQVFPATFQKVQVERKDEASAHVFYKLEPILGVSPSYTLEWRFNENRLSFKQNRSTFQIPEQEGYYQISPRSEGGSEVVLVHHLKLRFPVPQSMRESRAKRVITQIADHLEGHRPPMPGPHDLRV